MLAIYFVGILIFIVISAWIGYELITDSSLKGNILNKYWLMSFQFTSFLIVLFTLVNCLLCIYIYSTTKNKRGIRGDIGIPGIPGDTGRDGKCHSKCGQNSCYLILLKYCNQLFQEITKNKEHIIKNAFFLNKIQLICHSENYQSVLGRDHTNKPNEIKLINFIKDTIDKWIRLILSYDKYNKMGTKFLLTQDGTNNDWDVDKSNGTNPFDEIKKYDIWKWTENNKIKTIVRKQCLRETDLPEADKPPIKVINTNNYQPVYTSEKNHDIWGPENCPNWQLGYKNRNPSKKKWCWYSDKNKTGTKTWIQNKRMPARNKLSIYNPKVYTDVNGDTGFKKFYPVGSVWSSNDDIKKPHSSKCYPESSDKCDSINQPTGKGPKKQTILVSGDVKSPIRFNKIWDSKDGCKGCQRNNNHVSIWEPIAPQGYTCLGDVAKRGSQAPDNDIIKCIPSKCVDKVAIGKKVWDSEGLKEEHYPSPGVMSGTPKVPKLVSIWSAGRNEVDVDNRNRPDLNLTADGGYNLIRANDSNFKPPGDRSYTYVIKEGCLNPGKVNHPKDWTNKNSVDVLGSPERDINYSISSYLNKTPLGIIINSVTNKKYYIKHSGSKNSNSYFIQAFNYDNNDFSNCITINNKSILRSKSCNKSNNNQIWIIEPLKDSETDNVMRDKDSELILIKIKSKSTNKYFQQTYNNKGVLKESLVDGTNKLGPYVWKFKSVSGNLIPKN